MAIDLDISIAYTLMRKVTGLIYSEGISEGCAAPNLAVQVIKTLDSTQHQGFVDAFKQTNHQPLQISDPPRECGCSNGTFANKMKTD